MRDNIKVVKTEDGSIGLFSQEVGDIFHSTTGAYTESLEKFILPLDVLDFNNYSQLNILDICYGIGYNTKVFLDTLMSKNYSLNIKIHIDALEMDKDLFDINFFLKNQKISNKINLELLKKNPFIKFPTHLFKIFYKNISYHNIIYHLMMKKLTFLHNIYYRNISKRIKNTSKCSLYNNLSFSAHFEDARESLPRLDKKYDIIFHDGFAPAKLPTLWTIDFFKLLYEKLNSNGIILTYSKAASIRNAAYQSGFFIGNIFNKDNIPIGTIFSKDSSKIKHPLSDFDFGLLDTKAGIVYRDENLNLPANIILQERQEEFNNSSKISSGKYRKCKKNMI